MIVRRHLEPTFRYWMEVEVHVYGFSIAANVLLSFFPFLIVMVSLCKAFHWQAGEEAIYFTLRDYFPGQLADFVKQNIAPTLWKRGAFQWTSMLLLLFTANGIFEPMEVALNRIWGVKKNRSFLKNQLMSLGLIFACGSLALLSASLTAVNLEFIKTLTWASDSVSAALSSFFLKLAALPISMFILFLIYWLLPNCKIEKKRVVPIAIMVGFVLEVFKYIIVLLWPVLKAKLDKEYGPFVYSVSIILWSFLGSMLVLAGAEWSARPVAGGAIIEVSAVDPLKRS
jgi:membrane protein